MAVTKTKKRFVFDVSWVFAGLIFILVIRFIRKILLARYLGPTQIGLFSTCISIGSIVTLFAGFGMESTIVKYVTEFKEDKNKLSQLISNAFLIMIIFGTLSSFVLFIFSDKLASIFNMSPLSPLLKIFAISFPFTLIITIILGFFNGLREMKYFTYTNISRAFLAFIFILIPVSIGFGVKGAVFGYILAEVVIVCIFIFFNRRYFHFTFSTNNYKQTSKKLMSFGSKILGENVANTISYEADTLLIAYFLTATDVGYYTVAVAISRFFWLIPNAIQKVTFPATSEYWRTNNHLALQNMVDKCIKYTACVIFPVGLVIGFFAKDIIILIFGGNFSDSAPPLQLLIVGTVILGTVKSIGAFLAGIGQPGLSLKINSISAIINVVLNIFLIPLFGILGAALATMISFIVLAISDVYLMVKIGRIKVDIKPLIKLSVIAIFILYFFIYLNLINLYLSSSLMLGIYILSIYTFILTGEDKQMIISLIFSIISKFNRL